MTWFKAGDVYWCGDSWMKPFGSLFRFCIATPRGYAGDYTTRWAAEYALETLVAALNKPDGTTPVLLMTQAQVEADHSASNNALKPVKAMKKPFEELRSGDVFWVIVRDKLVHVRVRSVNLNDVICDILNNSRDLELGEFGLGTYLCNKLHYLSAAYATHEEAQTELDRQKSAMVTEVNTGTSLISEYAFDGRNYVLPIEVVRYIRQSSHGSDNQ